MICLFLKELLKKEFNKEMTEVGSQAVKLLGERAEWRTGSRDACKYAPFLFVLQGGQMALI